MVDLRPAGYVVGWLLTLLGAMMIVPAAVDLAEGDGNAGAFLISAMITLTSGAALALACGRRGRAEFDLRQGFLITTGSWLAFTGFATLPFLLGPPDLTYTDAFFETMSAMTTTGGTVIVGLESLPRGVLVWRALLQWIGGIGVILLAMILMPVLNIGGLQLLRTSDFNTLGKVLPRAKQMAYAFGALYAIITVLCAGSYAIAGMSGFDAVTHAMTTVATGGMANYDTSFAGFSPLAQYFATLFMVICGMSFVRFLQLGRGEVRPLFADTQIRAYLAIYGMFCAAILCARMLGGEQIGEEAVREVLFAVASILSTTGYATTDYQLWGSLAVVLVFCAGMICGCSGSTSGGPKVFRYQLMYDAISVEVRRLHRPSAVHPLHYQGVIVSPELISSVMAFFMMYFLTLGIGAVALMILGLTPITAISGAATCLANVGPGLGPEIGPAGNFAGIPDAAKWLMAFLMLAGRLELMALYVLLTGTFWRG